MTSQTVSYNAEDLHDLARAEERHFWFRARRRIIVDAIVRRFGGAKSYLEIGCGTGFNGRAVACALPNCRVVLSDPLARESDDFLRIDAREIPFENEFDVVGAYDVLEHIADEVSALVQMRRACRPGGGLVLTVPQHPWLWSCADVHAQHHRRYTSSGLNRTIENAGFEIIESTSFVSLALPLFLLHVRSLGASGAKPQLSVPWRPLNWLLEQSMNVDGMFIRTGVSLPVGASRLVVARRRD
jgi:SAM-dependent methyltransferase